MVVLSAAPRRPPLHSLQNPSTTKTPSFSKSISHPTPPHSRHGNLLGNLLGNLSARQSFIFFILLLMYYHVF